MAFIPTTRLVHNRKKQLNKRGEALIQLEVTHRSKRKFLSTGVYVKPSEWNGKYVIRHKDAISLNKKLDKLLKTIDEYINGPYEFSLSGLENYLKGGDQKSFPEYFQHYLDIKRDIEPSSRRQYSSALEHVKRYGKFKTFPDITYENIHEFDQYLVSQGLSGQTRRSVHKRVKMVVKHAYLSRRITFNDYERFRLPRAENGKIRFLTEEELNTIKNKKVHLDRLNRIRDIFLFQCYTGLAYSDIQKLIPEDITTENGDKWIITDRVKTGTTSEIFLLPEALELIEKYKGGDKLFPVPSNQKMNAFLKEIQDLAGIKKDLTSHVARHTFATICLNRGVNIVALQRTLGHSSIKTTENYAKALRETIKQEMQKMK